MATEKTKSSNKKISHHRKKTIVDRELALITVSKDGASLNFCSDELIDDKEIVLTAVCNSELAIIFASERIQLLCKNGEPIEILTNLINLEKLHIQLTETLPLSCDIKKSKMKL